MIASSTSLVCPYINSAATNNYSHLADMTLIDNQTQQWQTIKTGLKIAHWTMGQSLL